MNQKLLEAIFGEANVAAFVSRARDELGAILDGAFDDERARYAAALGGIPAEDDLAEILRDTAERSSSPEEA